MITRSQKKLLENDSKGGNGNNNDNDELDEYGNLKGFIDYDCNEDFDRNMFDKELDRLKGKIKHDKKGLLRLKTSHFGVTENCMIRRTTIFILAQNCFSPGGLNI